MSEGIRRISVDDAYAQQAPAQARPGVRRISVAEAYGDQPDRSLGGWVGAGARAVGEGITSSVGSAIEGTGIIGRRIGIGGQGLQDAGRAITDFGQNVIGPSDEYRGIATDILSGIGSMGTYLIPGAAATAPFRAAGALTRGAAGIAGASVMAGPSGAAEAYQRAIQADVPDEEALKIAMAGIPAGVVQVVPVAVLLRRIPPNVRGRAVGQIRHLAEAFGAEFIAEGAGALGQNLIEQSYNPERGTWDDTLYQAAIGGSASALLQLGISAATRGRGPFATTQGPDATRADEEQEPSVTPPSGTMGEQQAPMTATPQGTQAPATTPEQRAGMAVPPPTQDRERADSPRLTPEDRAAPEPNDLIDDGKQIMERALRGEDPVSDTKLRADTPPSQIVPETQGQLPGAEGTQQIGEGARVEVVTPDGEVLTGTVRGMVDIGQEEMATDFVSDQGEVSLFYPGEVQIRPVQPEAPTQPTTQAVPMGEPVSRQDAVVPQGQAVQQGRDVVPAPTTAPATTQQAPAQAPQAATQPQRALPAPDAAPAPQAAPQTPTAPQRSPAQLGRDWAGMSREQRAAATQGIEGLPANVLERRWGLIPASARPQIAERMAAMRQAPSPEAAAPQVTPPATQEPARPRRARRRREPRNLIEFIASQGGISVNDPLAQDIRDILGGGRSNRLVPGFGPLLQRARGQEIDRLRVAAIEAGYLDEYGARNTLVDTMTVPEFIEIIRAQLNPTRRDDASFAAEEAEQQAQYDEVREQIRAELIEAELTDRDINLEYLDLATMRVLDGLSEVQHAYVEAVEQHSRELEDAGEYRRLPEAETFDDLPGWDDADFDTRADAPSGDAPPARVDPAAQEQPGTVDDGAAGRDRAQEDRRAPREAEPEPQAQEGLTFELGAPGAERDFQAVVPGAEQRPAGEGRAIAEQRQREAEARARQQQSMIRRDGQRRVEDDEGGLFGERGADLFDAPAPAAQADAEAAQAETPTFPTTLEDIAPRGRFNHVYAEHQGRRYYLGSVAANADTMVEQMRDRFPGVAVFAVDRADSTRIHGDIDALQAAVGEGQADATPAPAETAEATTPGPANASDLNEQNGIAAYRNTSFSPERRARADIEAYVRNVNDLHAEMMERAETPEQQAIVDEEIARYREGYISRQNAVWAASSRTASPMITGPARFPVERNRKRMDAYDKRVREFAEWQERARNSIRRKVDGARPSEQIENDRWEALRRDLASSIATVRDIDAGAPFSRQLITGNIKSKLETRARRGETENVRRALDMLREAQANMARPIFTPRNSVWQLADRAQAVEATPTATGETTLATFDGARIVDNLDDSRVRIYFDQRPSREVTTALRSEGWRWSRNEGAWQRQNTNAARSGAQRIVGRFYERTEASPDDQQTFAVRGRTSPFFSPVERAVEGIQQERGNGLQWLAMIRKQPGVKQEELDWIGLPQWLSDRKGITKQEVLDYIAANKVSVVETVRGGTGRDQRMLEIETALDAPDLTDARRQALREEYRDLATEGVAPTAFGEYTLPGGENYRELLIQMQVEDTAPDRIDTIFKAEAAIEAIAPDVNFSRGASRYTLRDFLEEEGVFSEDAPMTDQQMIDYVAENYGTRNASEAADVSESVSDAGGRVFTSQHFDEPNILAHIRFNERTVDGERVLFIEEIQSDWHQTGRKKGYRSRKIDTTGWTAEREGRNWVVRDEQGGEVSYPGGPRATAQDAIAIAARYRQETIPPDAPLKKTWHETAFRRAVAWAVENGFDRVAWTTGQTQADRFDMSKRIDTIFSGNNGDGTWSISATKDGSTIFQDGRVPENDLSGIVGKEIAEKIIASGDGTRLSGLDLRVGGEGMKGFYDQIVPKYAQKWGRKFDAEVGKTRFPLTTRNDLSPEKLREGVEAGFLNVVDAWTMPITDQMRESIGTDGVPLFQAGDAMADQAGATPASADPRAFSIREDVGGITTEMTLTEPFVEASEALQASLREQLDQMGLRDVEVRVPQMIRFMTQEGEFSADGRYLRGVIDVALDAPDPNVTMRHEVIHALRRMGLFTETEWNILSGQSRRKWMDQHNVARDYAAFPEWVQVEEGIAYAFQGWQAGGQVTDTVARIFRKISNFLEALGNALRGNGFQSVDDIFARIESGEIGSRGLDADAGATDADQAFQIRRDEDNAARASAAMDAEDGGLGIEESTEIRGADRQFVADMGRWAKLAHYPRELASNSASFRPVYRAAVDQVQKRDLIIADLHRRSRVYFDLSNESRDKVNQVLEIGRLSGREYRAAPGKPLNVINDVRDTELSKKGERISLTAEEADAYRAVRDTMNSALGMFREQITREFGLDPAEFQTSKQIFDSINPDMPASVRDQRNTVGRLVREIEQAERTGYVPLSRFGNVIVTARKRVDINEINPLTGNPMEKETVWSRAVEIPTTGIAAYFRDKKAIKKIPAVRKVMEEASALYANDPDVEIDVFQKPERGVGTDGNMTPGDIDLLAEVANLSMDQHKQLKDALGKIKQERGFRRHFLGSRNVPGYDADFERSIADYISGIGGYLARREMNDTWESAIDAIPDLRPNEKAYAEKYRDYVNNPTEEFGNFRQAAFVYFLAGNISTAVLNLTQVPLFTMPYMSMFEAASFTRFARAYADTGRMMSTEAGTDIFTPEKAPADVRDAIVDYHNRGGFLPLVTFEMMGTANNRSRIMRGLSRKVRKAVDIVALTYSFSERANRISTFIAAYRLAKDKPDQVRQRARKVLRDNSLARDELLRHTDSEAFARAFAEWVIDETHFKLGKINRPEAFRAWGAPMLQFKSFLWSALTLQKRFLQGRYGRAGRVALGLNVIGLLATAGIWGLPGSEDLREALEAILRIWTEEDRDIQTEVREAITEMTGSPRFADLVSRGPLRATGIDMSQRIGLGRVVPRTADEAAGVPFSLMVGKPMSTFEYARRGDWMMAAGEMLPNFLRNPIQAIAWGEEGIRGVASGQMVIPPEEIGASDQVMRGLGFQPAWVARRREGDWASTRADRALDATRRRFYGMLARPIADAHRATQRGDVQAHARAVAAMEEAQSALQDHNLRAMEEGQPHRVIQIDNRSLRMRVQQELMGTAVRDFRGRTTTRMRRQELRDLYEPWPE